MKQICIYHAGCLDGQGAAAAFYSRYPDTVFYPGVYQEEPPDVQGQYVFLVDFSYPLHVLKELLGKARHVTIIDHHDTAIQALKDFEHPRLTKVLSNDNSGAVLTFAYLNPSTPIPQMLAHIEDRDLWRFDLTFTKPVTAYLYSMDFDIKHWSMLMDDSTFSSVLPTMIDAGAALMNSDAKRVQQLARNVQMIKLAGYLVPAVNAPHFHASDLGNQLSEGQPFAATYYDTPTHRIYSLRSDDNGVHVGEIATQFGGGGHKHAAGFKVQHSRSADV